MSSGTTVDKLSDNLAEAILSGEFAPGTRLDEQFLAQRYSVSVSYTHLTLPTKRIV